MPTYTFRNKDTNEVFDKFMRISERNQYLQDNPNIEPMLTSPFVEHLDYDRGKRPDEGFLDVLRNIKSRNISGKYMQSKYI